ncbi:hypothetical protein BBM21_08300 [Vibrio parahaemolyticus]|uniref:hypothetical protein n=1 Tax=Vibrio parahaemolyticus TaxID=670 RepID=UPI00084A78DB|nr:hypothetical protein [Vibrio parahaemolyticus]ODY31032.1 hypothetical protein BBM21_08300 [Vibrio parahaemolyticus]
MNKPYPIEVEISGKLNEEQITGKALGIAYPATGKYSISYQFDKKLRNLDLIVASWTSCGNTDGPMAELNGGKNLNTLSGGSYKFKRVIDFGDRGLLNVEFEVIREESGRTLGKGKVNGNLNVPKLVGLQPVKSVYKPISPGFIQAKSEIYYVGLEGELIKGHVHSEYHFDPKCECNFDQLRTSSIGLKRVDDFQVQLDWLTTIEPFEYLEKVRCSIA